MNTKEPTTLELLQELKGLCLLQMKEIEAIQYKLTKLSRKFNKYKIQQCK